VEDVGGGFKFDIFKIGDILQVNKNEAFTFPCTVSDLSFPAKNKIMDVLEVSINRALNIL
jgi:hypothetical protein